MEQIIANSVIAAGMYLLMAQSFAVIYSTIRFFHLAHGAVYTVGAYTGYSIIRLCLNTNQADGSQPVSIWIYIISALAAMVSAAIVGLLIDRFVYKPLRKLKASNLILLLASFGILIFIENLIALLYGNQILTIRTGPVKKGEMIFGAVITPVQFLIIMAAFCIFVLILIIVNYTRKGKSMRAVCDDSITASIIGINPERIILFTFILGSALAGLAGVLISLESNLEPTMGFNILLKGLIAVIIGGIGTFKGVLLGSLFLGFSENISAWYMPAGWKDAIVFGIFLLFLLFRPQGILGKKEN
jgi:branched-chain amino acid transport system permease protein